MNERMNNSLSKNKLKDKLQSPQKTKSKKVAFH